MQIGPKKRKAVFDASVCVDIGDLFFILKIYAMWNHQFRFVFNRRHFQFFTFFFFLFSFSIQNHFFFIIQLIKPNHNINIWSWKCAKLNSGLVSFQYKKASRVYFRQIHMALSASTISCEGFFFLSCFLNDCWLMC